MSDKSEEIIKNQDEEDQENIANEEEWKKPSQ